MKKFKLLVILALCMSLLSGCDFVEADEESKPAKKQEGIMGEWTIIAEGLGEEQMIVEDLEYNAGGTLSIYKEDRVDKIDFRLESCDSVYEVYGHKLEKVDGPMYEDCENQDSYYIALTKESEATVYEYAVSLLDADTLEFCYHSVYTSDEDDPYEYFTHYICKRNGTNIEQAKDEIRYKETITVSNVKDFYNAIGSNRIIVLEDGTYNFSELSEVDKDNKNVNWRYDYKYTSSDENVYDYYYFPEDQAFCDNVKNLIIRGAEDAEVHICTEDPIVAPLGFNGCKNITLENLKIGHLVEPGFCAGSVTEFRNTDNILIKNCRLYGSGTYGVWTDSCADIVISDSDIYECTYGLLRFEYTYDVECNDCILRDTSDLSMIDVLGGWNFNFNNCTFKDNVCIGEYSPFVNGSEDDDGDVIFNNCIFENNKYDEFSNIEVILYECDFKDL